MMYQVNNLSKNFRNYKYVVIRDCKEDVNSFYNNDIMKRYWYWGCYNDLYTAQLACDDCGNGFIAESENVEPLSFGEW